MTSVETKQMSDDVNSLSNSSIPVSSIKPWDSAWSDAEASPNSEDLDDQGITCTCASGNDR